MNDDCLYNIFVDGKLAHSRVTADRVQTITDKYADANHELRVEMIITNKNDFIPKKD